jgi:hypothetical protein
MKGPEKKRRLANDAARYLRQVGRKATPAHPNDRDHDRRLEQKLKRMPPEEVDALFRDDAD